VTSFSVTILTAAAIEKVMLRIKASGGVKMDIV
jgi:hypothetical protein